MGNCCAGVSGTTNSAVFLILLPHRLPSRFRCLPSAERHRVLSEHSNALIHSDLQVHPCAYRKLELPTHSTLPSNMRPLLDRADGAKMTPVASRP